MSGEAGNTYTGLEIGRILESTREKRGLSLQQVEEATKIRTRYLRDLENENFDVLPAVYVLGSLKTYAEYLGLDGAAMTTELKRRQASLQAEQSQEILEEPSPDESPGLLASLARLIGIGETAEDEAGTMSDSGRSTGLYVSLAVVLIFIFATYFASSLEEDQPSISQVHEPKTSQGPAEAALVGNGGVGERNTEAGKSETQPEEQAEASAKNDEVTPDSDGRVKDTPQAARASSSATALADAPTSAPASAPASTPASAPASASSAFAAPAPAKTRPEPVVVRPEPVARKKPAGGGREVAAAPTGRPAHAPGNPRVRKTKVIPVDAPRPNNKGPTTVTKIIRLAR